MEELSLSRNKKLIKGLERAEEDIKAGRATHCKSREEMHKFLDLLKE
ncbi:MAG: hypothetical protein GW779_00270 [Candidatus Altiarchaeum hamiconexum]|uniref:Uncharacterized protein n=1 Tax=Candidatus Altarchaeum hamiconexum TaxID=1803513 RepID=A0A8J7YT04_9ARCH|nr:hypothetical protein [Candidatus Altarchaeum hamiconexum]NCN69218.1 hypothetical protein [Candidatus Altarchaeum hamiconexum]NCS90849.1 hypothetical protein [Candidatus Altarchaeum hamiconexum]